MKMIRQAFVDALQHVTYKDWEFHVGEDGDRYYLQVRFEDDGDPQHGRKWWLSLHMTPSEVVQTALKAVLTAEEHEAREKFRYRDRPIFNPHIDVDALWSASSFRSYRVDDETGVKEVLSL